MSATACLHRTTCKVAHNKHCHTHSVQSPICVGARMSASLRFARTALASSIVWLSNGIGAENAFALLTVNTLQHIHFRIYCICQYIGRSIFYAVPCTALYVFPEPNAFTQPTWIGHTTLPPYTSVQYTHSVWVFVCACFWARVVLVVGTHRVTWSCTHVRKQKLYYNLYTTYI